MLNKQPININFSQGLDLKTDPFQVAPGRFLFLSNSIFGKGGLLQKRNGFEMLAALPDATSIFATTFNGNLTALGTSSNAYSQGSNTWVNKGALHPLNLTTLSLVRNNNAQTQSDTAIAPNGLVCVVYTDVVAGTNTYKYSVLDSVTGQNIIAPTLISGADATLGTPKVFQIGRFFVIVFTNKVVSTYHLKYMAINVNTLAIVSAVDISTSYTPSSTVAWDGVVANDTLYLAWNGSDGGGAIRLVYLDQTLTLSATKVFAGRVATIMSVTADTTAGTAVIYASFYDLSSTTGYTLAVNQQLVTVHAPTQIIASGTILNLTSSAMNGICTFFYETAHNYSYDSSVPTHFTSVNTITQSGTVGTAHVFIRSLGLGSKSFIIGTSIYVLGTYQSGYQPTYFLLNSSAQVVLKLAYENGGGYYVTGLPSVVVNNNIAQFSYLFKDFIQAINTTQGAPSGGAPVYSQTGINLASVNFSPNQIISSEIGSNLNISGGVVYGYDGIQATEQGFNLWPDSIEATWSTTGGNISAQPDGTTNTNAYFYQVTYEWTDNQGNLFRSAPSIPIGVTTTGSGIIGSITVNIPTLRVTYKITNPVKLVVYRWSVANQTYYQVTSITSPTLNDPTIDSIAFVDTLADSAILGNDIIYTDGGTVENIGPPATSILTLFKSRLFLVDAEDPNLLWYSKSVIEATPVEMSDLFTIFVAPSVGSQGSTGPITALAALDDKLIIFKKDAIYYLTGTGPDNTGANNDFSEPTFITATVGCTNQQSIVFMPQGLMFQSDKGIWLLGRDLSTTYIGAPVETYNSFSVLSALNIPGTNRVIFTLSNGVTLMYDYFFGQWGTFNGIPSISSTLYQGLHTFIDSFGRVFQETPGLYLDGGNPVLMSFTTSWLNLAGLQGYERAYFFYLLGTYLSPHVLSIGIAYDYNSSIQQQVNVNPINFAGAWGSDPLYGDSPVWGGASNIEQWRVFFDMQKCQSFQITIQENYDSSFGVPPGAGFTLSGLDVIVGLKRGYPRVRANIQTS